MKRFMLIFCSLLITLGATAQSKLGSQTTKIAKDSTLIKIHDLLEDVDFRIHGLDRYKLYPTENIYNFLQLDTSTGKIDVVQWSLDDGKEGSVTLNDEGLLVSILAGLRTVSAPAFFGEAESSSTFCSNLSTVP